MAYVEEDGFDDFSTGSKWTKQSGGGNITFGVPWKGETTVEMIKTGTSGYDYITLLNVNTQGTTVLRGDFYPTNLTDGNPHVLYFDHQALGARCSIKYYTGGTLANKFVFQKRHNYGSYDDVYTFQLDAPRNQWYTVELEKREDDTCRGWVYPRGEGRNYADMWVEPGYPSGWSPAPMSAAGGDSPYYLANFYVGDVIETRTYADGLGRPIQTQTIDRDSVLVSALQYDAVGRQSHAWEAYKNVSSFFTYNSQATASTATTGSALKYFNDISLADNNRPYTETIYEASPLGRASKIRPPGISVDNSSVRLTYTTSTLNGAGGTSPVYTLNKTEDEDEIITEEYYDTFGNKVQVVTGNGMAVTDFEYNELGQLIKAISPENYPTHYTYDQRGRLIAKTTPDASGDGDSDPAEENGTSTFDYRYKYDNSGNLRFLEDPNQRDTGNFIYYKYDEHNRLIEEGMYTGTTTFDTAGSTYVDVENWPTDDLSDITTYTYEGAQLKRAQVRGNSLSGFTYDYYDYFYDAFGRVVEIQVNIDEDGFSCCKQIEYEYDLQDRVTKMTYSESLTTTPSYYTWHVYDEAGRLAEVRTNDTNSFASASIDARYDYTSRSQVARLKQGDYPVQSLEYFYNIRGWLTGINDPANLTDNSSFAHDVFGLRLGYDTLDEITHSSAGMSSSIEAPQFNGNISWTTWKTKDNDFPVDYVGYVFKYDDLNRLKAADYGQYNQNQSNWKNKSFFDVGLGAGGEIVYDKNGNIEKMNRYDEAGVATVNDPLYVEDSNQLKNIAGSSDWVYDANGNVTTTYGLSDQHSNIIYDYRNLPTLISNIGYDYDASGQRIYQKDNNTGEVYFYVRGLNGEVLAVYDSNGALRYRNIVAGGQVIGKVLQ